MRFTIPLTLFFAALAIAAPAAEADNDVDAAVSEDPGLADAQRCRPGYRQCMDVCLLSLSFYLLRLEGLDKIG